MHTLPQFTASSATRFTLPFAMPYFPVIPSCMNSMHILVACYKFEDDLVSLLRCRTVRPMMYPCYPWKQIFNCWYKFVSACNDCVRIITHLIRYKDVTLVLYFIRPSFSIVHDHRVKGHDGLIPVGRLYLLNRLTGKVFTESMCTIQWLSG